MMIRNILPNLALVVLLLAPFVAGEQSPVQHRQMEESNISELASDSITVSTAPRTCLAKTVSMRKGPVYVAFQLPPSEAGRQFNFDAGRAYRESEGTCYSVGWSNHSFVCDDETQEYIQLRGSWPVTTEIPQDCVNGGGSMENHNQPYLMVFDDMKLTCPGKSIDVFQNPIHVRFSLPEGRDTFSSVFYNFGSAGRKVDGQCYQIEWTNLVFTCDADFEWRLASGQWRVPQQPLGCESWAEGIAQLSNTEQQFLQVVDITGAPPCGETEEKRTSGPLSVAFQLPGDLDRGTKVAYESGQAVSWFNRTCHNLMWTDHKYVCDGIAGKWVLESGDFLPSPTDPRFCNGLNGGYILNGDQPYLEVMDISQTDSPTPAPFEIIRPIITESPSWSPTSAPVPPLQRPIETNIPQAPTVASIPGWPTSAPFAVVKPLEPSGSNPTSTTSSNGGASYATDPPPTMRPTNTPTVTSTTPLPSPSPTLTPAPVGTVTATTTMPSNRPTPLPTIANATPGPTSITVQPTMGVVVSSSITTNPTGSPVSVAPTSTPPPTSVATSNNVNVNYCGCPSCTSAIWNSDADSFTCGERITYIVNSVGSSMADACRQVAGQEFPDSCGPFCDPDSCQSIGPDSGIAVGDVDTAQPTTMAPIQSTTTVAPTQPPTVIIDPTSTSITQQPSTASPTAEITSLPVQSDTGGTPALVNSKPGISAGLAASPTQTTVIADSTTLGSTQAPSPSGTLVLSTDEDTTNNLRAVSGAAPSSVSWSIILLFLLPVYQHFLW